MINSELRTNLYNNKDVFKFLIVNFPIICSNIRATSAYGIYISQLIRYSSACGFYHEFLDRALLLIILGQLLNQRVLMVKLKSSLTRSVTKYKLMCRQDRQGVWGPMKVPSESREEPLGRPPPGAQRFLGF